MLCARGIWRGEAGNLELHSSFEEFAPTASVMAGGFCVFGGDVDRGRGRQVVRQRSAKPLSAVRFRLAPPEFIDYEATER